MKKNAIVRLFHALIMTMLPLSTLTAQTYIGGQVESDVLWTTQGSPYILNGEVQIAPGAKLTLAPGVVVNGNGNRLIVAGELDAKGNFGAEIEFSQLVIEVFRGSAQLEFSLVSGGGLLCSFDSEDYSLIVKNSIVQETCDLRPFGGGKLTLDRNVFYNAGVFDVGQGGNVEVTNNTFQNDRVDMERNSPDPYAIKYLLQTPFFADPYLVANNSFLSLGSTAIAAVKGFSIETMDATRNFWRAVNVAEIENLIYDRQDSVLVEGVIAYEPFLSAPHPRTPAPIYREARQDVQKMYIAYYGRPGDVSGLQYWGDRLEQEGGNLAAIINAFGTSDEYIERFALLPPDVLVNNLYRQMFGRDAESGGRRFYVDRIEQGESTLAEIALQIADGARNEDFRTVTHRLAAANYYTDILDLHNLTYTLADIPAAFDILASLNQDPETLPSAREEYALELLGLTFSD